MYYTTVLHTWTVEDAVTCHHTVVNKAFGTQHLDTKHSV